MTTMLQYAKKQWPVNREDVPNSLKPYWLYRDGIYEKDGLLFKSNRAIIPKQFINTNLAKLHEAHSEVEKTLYQTMQAFYYPTIHQVIKNTVKKLQHMHKKTSQAKTTKRASSQSSCANCAIAGCWNWLTLTHWSPLYYSSGQLLNPLQSLETSEDNCESGNQVLLDISATCIAHQTDFWPWTTFRQCTLRVPVAQGNTPWDTQPPSPEVQRDDQESSTRS